MSPSPSITTSRIARRFEELKRLGELGLVKDMEILSHYF
jgi:hypothetical protein